MGEKGSEGEESGDEEEDDEGSGPGWDSVCANAWVAVSVEFLVVEILGHAREIGVCFELFNSLCS